METQKNGCMVTIDPELLAMAQELEQKIRDRENLLETQPGLPTIACDALHPKAYEWQGKSKTPIQPIIRDLLQLAPAKDNNTVTHHHYYHHNDKPTTKYIDSSTIGSIQFTRAHYDVDDRSI